MSKKDKKRKKTVPHRTCVGCREVLPKRSLTRVVRTPDGVQIDPTGKLAGRGAYLHNQKSCWERALKGSLEHALKINLTNEDLERMLEYMQALGPENIATTSQASVTK